MVQDPGLTPAARISAALARIDLWSGLASAARAAGVPQDELCIVIVPELGAFAEGSPAATDPVLVEALIDLLHDRGYSSVAVGGGADGSSLWAANRTVYALTDILGYRFVTPGGRDYDIIDLAEDLVPAPFRPGELLAGSELSRTWLEADCRIVFAANATDEADGYSLGLRTVMRALPLTDEGYFYRLAAPPGDLVAELLRVTPVALTLIDGIVSCHGSAGTRAPRSIVTDCVIAATDIFLGDAVGAIKMGLDPGVSSLAVHSPWRNAAVAGFTVDGDLAPYREWTSPHPMLREAVRRRDASPWWSRLLRPWLQVIDTDLFPLESPLDARLNARLAPWFSTIDADGGAYAAFLMLNAAAAGFQDVIDGYRMLFDKDSVPRIDAPLGFDAQSVAPTDYDAIVPELRALENLLLGAPERRPGLRWRSLDRAVLFDYRREIPIDFDGFVAAVDVSRAISYMNDYIGGVVVEVGHDAAGRPVRQAERNLYLPQPNYLVLSGGLPIDVSKLEFVEYTRDRHTLYWKTIDSTNGTARYDDGIVTFARDRVGTAVTIFGRQEFVLPPQWEWIHGSMMAELREHLVTDAYATFFDRTLANLEALAEGREIRIGRPWADPMQPPPLPSQTIETFVTNALDWLGTVGGRAEARQDSSGGAEARIDADGFRHFTSLPRAVAKVSPAASIAAAASDFWTGLFVAGMRDLGSFAEVRR